MRMNKILPLFAISAMTILFLTACGGSSGPDGGGASWNEATNRYDEELVFTIGRMQRNLAHMPEGDTIEDNPASRFLLDQLNIRADVEWETGEFNQRVALAISTGELPDVMTVNRALYEELLESGLLADLTDAWNNYASDSLRERMASYDVDVLGVASDADGRLRAIPTPFIYYEQTLVWIREDWLSAVGADLPRNIDELGQLAMQFIDAGLSESGATYGFTLGSHVSRWYGASWDANPIFNAVGAFPAQWVERDGQAVYGSIQPEMREALAILRDWYSEGILDPQFAVRSADERNGVLIDSVGIHFAPWWAVQFEMAETIRNNPEANWVALYGLENENGELHTFRGTPVVRYTVVRNGFEHPEAIIRALNNVTDWNFRLTDEARTFRAQEFEADTWFPWFYAPIDVTFNHSFENRVRYTYLNEAIETNSDANLPPHLAGEWEMIRSYLENGRSDVQGWAEYAAVREGLRVSISDSVIQNYMAFWGRTASMPARWADLETLENEVFLRIIMGEEPLEHFDWFVEEWYLRGGGIITEEVNEKVSAGNVK